MSVNKKLYVKDNAESRELNIKLLSIVFHIPVLIDHISETRESHIKNTSFLVCI